MKTPLVLPAGVNFRTGNVDFGGDVRCLGDVACGFRLRGRDVLVDGAVIRAMVTARRDATLTGGARGNFQGNCLIRAGRNLKARFADKAELRARGALELGHALHSRMLAGSLLAHGSINGGVCRVLGSALVEGDLGCASGTATRVHLEDVPFLDRPLRLCRDRLDRTRDAARRYEPLAGKQPPDDASAFLARKLARAARRIGVLERQLQLLLDMRGRILTGRRPPDDGGLSPSSDHPAAELRVIGTAHPGVTITFGDACLTVNAPLRGIRFRREGGSVAVSSLPEPS